MSDSVTRVSSILPDAFYDIIAYVIPSTFLLCGLYFSGVLNLSDQKTIALFDSTTWVFEIIIGLLLIGILYTIGVIIATLSFYFSRLPIKFLLLLFKKPDDDFNRGFGGKILRLKKKDNRDLYLEMTKRYSRVMLLRSLFLVFFILMLVTIFTRPWHEPVVYLGLCLVTLFSYYRRNIWLRNHFRIVDDLLT